jgi:hypothetical protein
MLYAIYSDIPVYTIHLSALRAVLWSPATLTAYKNRQSQWILSTLKVIRWARALSNLNAIDSLCESS